jgi:Na+/H+ antiporter NhaC
VQGAGFEAGMNAAFSGFVGETGNADVDDLLTRGGLESMLFTISLIIVAMMFGGVMQKTGQLRVVAERILKMANSTGSLVLSTALTAVGSLMTGQIISRTGYTAIVPSIGQAGCAVLGMNTSTSCPRSTRSRPMRCK